MKLLKKILKAFLIVILVLFAGLAGLIAYAMITDYKPAEKIMLLSDENPVMLTDTAEVSLMTWNIGYCGLDSEMDFFYDGGTKVMTPEPKCLENLAKAEQFLKQNDTIDFFLIQEMDKDSKRSYHINEYDSISKILDKYNPVFAINYKVFFVPVPPSSPMGKVLSGLAIYGKFKPATSVRFPFPGEYGFPKQLFMLDRCFIVNRYPLKNGRELLIINTHNEAFDPGEIRKAQMIYLKEFLLSEYAKGNYIITGGDWNQSPPDFKAEFKDNVVNHDQMVMPSDYLPADWQWVYDNSTPSNRTVIASYDPATTTTTVIDLFLLSPNIEKISVECVNLNFENSDHNPVRIKVKLGNRE